MNLVIDLGNTSSKLAIFHQFKPIAFETYEQITVGNIIDFLSPFDTVKSAILCSVVHHANDIEMFLNNHFHFINLKTDTPYPIENLYRTPETLGPDRLAVAVGANHLFPNRNVLAIDAGTCIKYEFVNAQNQYLGGNISPGIDMRFRALNKFTDKLPLLSQEKTTGLYGTSTEDAIRKGVQYGAIAEIKGVIATFSSQYTDLATVVTGGDAIYVERELKNGIFAAPFLLMNGLNIILNHNAQ